MALNKTESNSLKLSKTKQCFKIIKIIDSYAEKLVYDRAEPFRFSTKWMTLDQID